MAEPAILFEDSSSDSTTPVVERQALLNELKTLMSEQTDPHTFSVEHLDLDQNGIQNTIQLLHWYERTKRYREMVTVIHPEELPRLEAVRRWVEGYRKRYEQGSENDAPAQFSGYITNKLFDIDLASQWQEARQKMLKKQSR